VPRRFIGLIVVGLLQRWADTCRLARRSWVLPEPFRHYPQLRSTSEIEIVF